MIRKEFLISSLAAILIVIFGLALVGNSHALTPRYNPVIDPANFVGTIDNPFYPLIPGTVFVYNGTVAEGSEVNFVNVTHATKMILGVTCTVVNDTVFLEGSLIEATLDWFAQDKQGNVWYFGEDAKEYSNGAVTSTEGSWEAGVNGAHPGIVMEAEPEIGDFYRQEYLAGVAEDLAQVRNFDGLATVPYGTFEDCLVTKEWSPLEHHVLENKYYAEGVGEVLSITIKGGPEVFTLTQKLT